MVDYFVASSGDVSIMTRLQLSHDESFPVPSGALVRLAMGGR